MTSDDSLLSDLRSQRYLAAVRELYVACHEIKYFQDEDALSRASYTLVNFKEILVDRNRPLRGWPGDCRDQAAAVMMATDLLNYAHFSVKPPANEEGEPCERSD